MPLRRLIVTGRDTTDNLRLLLGSDYNDTARGMLEEERLKVLIEPPQGSPEYAMIVSQRLDEGCPYRAPRPPTADEEAGLKGIRAMQELVKNHMGSRCMSSIKSSDMAEVLSKNFNSSWVEALPLYQSAINAMDQGVRVDY